MFWPVRVNVKNYFIFIFFFRFSAEGQRSRSSIWSHRSLPRNSTNTWRSFRSTICTSVSAWCWLLLCRFGSYQRIFSLFFQFFVRPELHRVRQFDLTNGKMKYRQKKKSNAIINFCKIDIINQYQYQYLLTLSILRSFTNYTVKIISIVLHYTQMVLFWMVLFSIDGKQGFKFLNY